jgi:hypothetical protein
MHAACESMGRQPLGHGIGIDEGAKDALCRSSKNTLKLDGMGHGFFLRTGHFAKGQAKPFSNSVSLL